MMTIRIIVRYPATVKRHSVRDPKAEQGYLQRNNDVIERARDPRLLVERPRVARVLVATGRLQILRVSLSQARAGRQGGYR